jgi:hypothetical protein
MPAAKKVRIISCMWPFLGSNHSTSQAEMEELVLGDLAIDPACVKFRKVQV